MITAAGAGSGIDVESIISQLMSLERRPINVLQQRQSSLDVELSDVGKLHSRLSAVSTIAEKLADADQFGAWDAVSSDEDILTATNEQGRVAENHTIQVTALASAHRLHSTAFASETAQVTPGQFDFSSGDESFSVTIIAGQDSLLDLRDAINESVDNTTIQASILNTDIGSQLVLTAANPGTANTITAPAEFSELNAASDAELTINGLAVTSSSNVLTQVVPGLTMELKSIGAADISSTRNIESIAEMFEEFSESYNALRDTLSSLNEGSLRGDSILRRIESSLRNEFFAPIDPGDGTTRSIFEFGLTFDKFGVLSVDEDKLSDVLSKNVSLTVNSFTTAETGFADRIIAALATFTQAGGYLDNREEAIDQRDRAIDTQIDRLEARMEQVEIRYRRQFSSMDTMITQLQSNGNYLSQTLASLE